MMGRHRQGSRRTAPRTATASAAQSSSCSATHRRTTPSWRALSTAPASRTASSTWAFPARALCSAAIQKARDTDNITEIAEIIKKTAFKITRMGQLVAQEASRRLCVPFGIVDLSLAPTPAIGDSVADILEGMGLAQLRRTRHHSCTGSAQRRCEKGRRHGVLTRWRPFRRVHPGQ